VISARSLSKKKSGRAATQRRARHTPTHANWIEAAEKVDVSA